jgi:uncharacterized protein
LHNFASFLARVRDGRVTHLCMVEAHPAYSDEFWHASMRYVLFYESADDVASRAPPHFPAHKARLDEFHASGTLLMVGTFGNPQEEGSMAIFTTREAAEDFAKGDPFVLNGVVRDWHVREWDEILAP